MEPIYDQRKTRQAKQFNGKDGVDTLIIACGETCDDCPIVVLCEQCFKVEPRKWRKYAYWHGK